MKPIFVYVHVRQGVTGFIVLWVRMDLMFTVARKVGMYFSYLFWQYWYINFELFYFLIYLCDSLDWSIHFWESVRFCLSRINHFVSITSGKEVSKIYWATAYLPARRTLVFDMHWLTLLPSFTGGVLGVNPPPPPKKKKDSEISVGAIFTFAGAKQKKVLSSSPSLKNAFTSP